MAETPTISELFKAKEISEEEIDTAITDYVAGALDEFVVFADIYRVNMAAAVQAHPQLRDRAHDPDASEFLKRIAVRTALMLARPETL
ncbi:hypothetical protein [Methylobacterium durans]|uniref:Uncharacterized protein n=1 Tax=Methylobacterium durans TaxID=2202825 RepID=A0A2U8W0L2_9HYPH|nr:hypothetical protein [Methylobacterium durans]AWN39599.1 hypothetical protein DK389_02465 [Methylobacterium durans]